MPYLVFALVMAMICAAVANSRGRSALGWFFIGFFFGIFSLIVLFVIPDLKELEAREERLRDENRRLREQVKSHRMVADQRHERQERRLTVHDRALGVDTGSAPQLTDGDGAPPQLDADPPPLPRAALPATAGEFAAAAGAYAAGAQARGPVSFEDLRALRQGDVTPAALVWTPGMPGGSPSATCRASWTRCMREPAPPPEVRTGAWFDGV
jgi:hypothetical protein